jgi:cation-transporting ATPase I
VSDVADTEKPAKVSGARRRVLAAARAATPDQEGGRRLPHPTDRAILYATEKAGLHRDDELGGWARLADLPFEPRRGYHATLGRTGDERRIFVKGAPEVLLGRCRYRLSKDGRRITAAAARRDDWQAKVTELAGRGLRVLVVAERELEAGAGFDDHSIDDLTFLGLLGLKDPVRSTSAEALDDLARAGVRTIMITGDHPVTAAGIAAELGLSTRGVLTGTDIDRLTDTELGGRLGEVDVCARVTPAHKVRIVRALQQQDLVVAMTGDGANDAPAIRLADVGVALGTRATDAARDASDLVVTDDRIETIVAAVVEGRALWASVRDATAILVGGNLGEITFTLAGSALTGTAPINTRQLLLVNLMTDVLPAMAIAVSPPVDTTPEDLLTEGPDASLGESLNRAIAQRAAVTTVGTTAGWLSARLTGRARRASTVALASLVGTELGQTLATGWRSPLVVASSLGSMGALVGIIQTPGLSQMFGCTPLGPLAWSQALTSAGIATVGGELVPEAIRRVSAVVGR